MTKYNEIPSIAFVGTCYRGTNITMTQLNSFKEHYKNIITFLAFTSSTVSEKKGMEYMLDYDNFEVRIPIFFTIIVKKETAFENLIKQQEELKEEEKMLKDKPRPLNIAKFSEYKEEGEVLFSPLSSFKIDCLPQMVQHDNGVKYYKITLEYIDTFVHTN